MSEARAEYYRKMLVFDHACAAHSKPRQHVYGMRNLHRYGICMYILVDADIHMYANTYRIISESTVDQTSARPRAKRVPNGEAETERRQGG